MEKEQLARLIEKHRQGLCSPEESALLEKWLERMDVLTAETPVFSDDEDVRKTSAILWRGIAPHKKQLIWPTLRMAAAWIGVLTFAGALYFIARTRATEPAPELITLTAEQGTLQQVSLPDGSTAWLNASTTIRYPKKFASAQRVIELVSGEAIFEVQRDTLHPFLVQSKNITTRVLGTRFTVTAYHEMKTVTVSVSHGKVEVYDSTQVFGQLVKNQALQYDLSTGRVLEIQSDRVQFDPDRGALYLKGCTFDELAARIYHAYGYSLHPVNEAVRKRLFTGEINLKESVVTTLTAFSTIHNGTIQLKGKEIYMD